MRLKACLFLGFIEALLFTPVYSGPALASADLAQPLLVAQFPAAGEVCLDAEHQRELVNALKVAQIPNDARVTLVAYSDRLDMRDENWAGVSPCVIWQLPGFMRGHERIAALRAYYVISLARQAGVMAFRNAPVLTFGPQPKESLSLQSSGIVHIVPTRSDGTGPRYRKVEIHWTQLDPSSPPLSPVSLEVSTLLSESSVHKTAAAKSHEQPFSVQMQSRESAIRRPMGLSILAFGLASVGLGISLVAVAGARTNDALGTLEPTRRLAQLAQADEFGAWGGASLAFGVGLSAAGLIIARPWRAWPPPSAQLALETPAGTP